MRKITLVNSSVIVSIVTPETWHYVQNYVHGFELISVNCSYVFRAFKSRSLPLLSCHREVKLIRDTRLCTLKRIGQCIFAKPLDIECLLIFLDVINYYPCELWFIISLSSWVQVLLSCLITYRYGCECALGLLPIAWLHIEIKLVVLLNFTLQFRLLETLEQSIRRTVFHFTAH